VVKKGLGVRVHACSCGLVLDRDTNAAINIARRGQRLRGGLNESVDPRSPYLAVCGR
jgi:transposase